MRRPSGRRDMLLQLLRLMMRDEGLDQPIQLAVQDAIELIEGETDARGATVAKPLG